ncbi:hypothetical protein [Acinetobacter wuhouensis]|uniref:Uncharacterized protein n=1 Tax=Acinetobacter wuhouensis TaxID=1879050 RepID=A0A3G2SZ99_9GAMM|nr:hypothetical protein [Acinetobacter wuhouensis]AYO53220.1 hypothetical protein CDG68_05875 [Acinetobacter wuhouensis]
MSDIQQKLKLRELEIVDEHDQPRIRLSVEQGLASIQLLNLQGEVGARIELDQAGFSKIQLASITEPLLNVKLEMDPKGSHIKFDHQNGASNYLFLNNQGASGLVMLDAQQQRKFAATVSEQGVLKIDQ